MFNDDKGIEQIASMSLDELLHLLLILLRFVYSLILFQFLNAFFVLDVSIFVFAWTGALPEVL